MADEPFVPPGGLKIEPWECATCGATRNAVARIPGKDGSWYDVHVAYRLSDGSPVNTAWSGCMQGDEEPRQEIRCGICHETTPFTSGTFWGMEYDTNGRGVYRNIFVDGYFSPFE